MPGSFGNGLVVVTLIIIAFGTVGSLAEVDDPLVHFVMSDLDLLNVNDSVTSWPNRGSLGGDANQTFFNFPFISERDGKRCVYFNGSSHLYLNLNRVETFDVDLYLSVEAIDDNAAVGIEVNGHIRGLVALIPENLTIVSPGIVVTNSSLYCTDAENSIDRGCGACVPRENVYSFNNFTAIYRNKTSSLDSTLIDDYSSNTLDSFANCPAGRIDANFTGIYIGARDYGKTDTFFTLYSSRNWVGCISEVKVWSSPSSSTPSISVTLSESLSNSITTSLSSSNSPSYSHSVTTSNSISTSISATSSHSATTSISTSVSSSNYPSISKYLHSVTTSNLISQLQSISMNIITSTSTPIIKQSSSVKISSKLTKSKTSSTKSPSSPGGHTRDSFTFDNHTSKSTQRINLKDGTESIGEITVHPNTFPPGCTLHFEQTNDTQANTISNSGNCKSSRVGESDYATPKFNLTISGDCHGVDTNHLNHSILLQFYSKKSGSSCIGFVEDGSKEWECLSTTSKKSGSNQFTTFSTEVEHFTSFALIFTFTGGCEDNRLIFVYLSSGFLGLNLSIIFIIILLYSIKSPLQKPLQSVVKGYAGDEILKVIGKINQQ